MRFSWENINVRYQANTRETYGLVGTLLSAFCVIYDEGRRLYSSFILFVKLILLVRRHLVQCWGVLKYYLYSKIKIYQIAKKKYLVKVFKYSI